MIDIGRTMRFGLPCADLAVRRHFRCDLGIGSGVQRGS